MSVLEEKGSDHLISCFVTGGIAACHLGSDPLTQIARALMRARAQAIYEALFGADSATFVRLTHRIGNGHLSQSAYRKLIDLMYRFEHRDRARLLTQGCPISEVSIEVALRLPPSLLRQEFICGLHSVEQVEQVRAALDLILSLLPESAHGELWQSLSSISLSRPRALSKWLRRMIDKVPSFSMTPPLKDDPDVTFLSSPAAMHDCARRFSNCLKDKVPLVALQRNAYYEWRSPGAIIELRSLSHGYWLAGGIHGMKNGPVDAVTLRAIRTKLDAAGILVPAQFAHAKHINRCASLLGVYDFSGPDLGEEDFGLQLEDAT
jgi:hypothetical protein